MTRGIPGRSPGAVLSRLHAGRRGIFELVAMAASALLSGLVWGPFGAVLGAVFTALLFLVSAQVRGATETADRSARQTYAQLEALLWLRDQLGLRQPLRPTRGFAASPDMLLELVRLVGEHEPRVILELGSGVSTIVLAARTKGRLISLEHDAIYADATRQELTRHGLEAEVIVAPLMPVTIGGATWKWYTLPEDVPNIDMLVVDGPPGLTGTLARYPALPLLHERLSPSALICIDDAVREDEQQMVERWLAEYPGWTARHIPTEAGTYVLTRSATRAKPKLIPTSDS